MSVRASVTLFGGQNDMNLAKTGNGDSCNVFGGVSKVAAHQLNGTVFYLTVAADQQLSQCNLGAPHAAGQVFAARAPAACSRRMGRRAPSTGRRRPDSRVCVRRQFHITTPRARRQPAMISERPRRRDAGARLGPRRRRGDGRGAWWPQQSTGDGRRRPAEAFLHSIGAAAAALQIPKG